LSENAISVSGLTKEYGEVRAVDGISFDVKAGEIFAFLGPNGAGKTSTIEILECIRPLSSGKALVLGFDVTKPSEVKEIKKLVGVLPQDFSAFERLTVHENVELFARMYERGTNPADLMRILGLETYAKKKFVDLSGGLKQRVGVAAAMVGNPRLLFLDEPTSGLTRRLDARCGG
jgi:ABC-2 type transport system ATP-binding protein